MRALLLGLLVLMALAPVAGAATVRVEPFRESAGTPGSESCARLGTCPQSMLVFIAAPGESNDLTIALETTGITRDSGRHLVRDAGIAPLQAGPGCERIEDGAAACTAESVGPLELGDRADRIAIRTGFVSGGDGDDIVTVLFGSGAGGEGDDVLTVAHGEGGPGQDVLAAENGDGGPGDDVLSVAEGEGGPGDDLVKCLPQALVCAVRGGPGEDTLIGGRGSDELLGGRGRDILRGLRGKDKLTGGPGDDLLLAGAGADLLLGGPGADRLEAREDRSLEERPARDRVNCGPGRRDRALADRRDKVTRCERITPRRSRRR